MPLRCALRLLAAAAFPLLTFRYASTLTRQRHHMPWQARLAAFTGEGCHWSLGCLQSGRCCISTEEATSLLLVCPCSGGCVVWRCPCPRPLAAHARDRLILDVRARAAGERSVCHCGCSRHGPSRISKHRHGRRTAPRTIMPSLTLEISCAVIASHMYPVPVFLCSSRRPPVHNIRRPPLARRRSLPQP